MYDSHSEQILISMEGKCHKCGASDPYTTIQETRLQPIFVWQKDKFLQTQLCPRCARWHLMYWLKVRWKLRIGRISDWFAPGYSHCGRCKTNWYFVDGHSTEINDSWGCFPLCKQCWAELMPTERLPFYQKLYDEWKRASLPLPYSWSEIERAVLDGR